MTVYAYLHNSPKDVCRIIGRGDSAGEFMIEWLTGGGKQSIDTRKLNKVPTDYLPKHIELWKLPKNYFGEVWPGWYSSGFGRSRDSDCLEESNFETVIRHLGGESETVRIVRESHWAVGWVEWIAIEQSDYVSLWIADHLARGYLDYPVLDEEDWCNRENDYAQNVWRDCYDDAKRLTYIRRWRDQFEFRTYRDLIECVRGRYFCGYASDLIS